MVKSVFSPTVFTNSEEWTRLFLYSKWWCLRSQQHPSLRTPHLKSQNADFSLNTVIAKVVLPVHSLTETKNYSNIMVELSFKCSPLTSNPLPLSRILTLDSFLLFWKILNKFSEQHCSYQPTKNGSGNG